jgi:CrcB protein
VRTTRSALVVRVTNSAAVFVGGALGAGTRWGLIELIGTGRDFPWPTLVANLVGAALLGALAGLVARSMGSGFWWSLLGIGFAGALTTFSTFVLEGVDLLDDQGAAAAAWYTGMSILAGLRLAGWAQARVAGR